jgi:predicted amidophosphoribosyltransferase
MHLTKDQLSDLSKKRACPRCDLDKTVGNALCRRCRSKLPPHMRLAVENIPAKDGSVVGNALRAAANYFTVHFASVRKFGGGRKRD